MSFDLEIPDPEEVKEIVKKETAITPAYAEAVDSAANEKGDHIINVNLDSVASRREITSAVNDLGSDIMERSANKNAIMAKRMGELSRGGSESGEVAKSLENLAIKMRDLDPSGIDFAKQGPLGKLFNPVRRYFERYKNADAEIADIVKSLGDQFKRRHSLSARQVAALRRVLYAYRDKIPGYAEKMRALGFSEDNAVTPQ